MIIDYSRDNTISSFVHNMLRERYMLPNETSPQEAFMRAARAFADDAEHAQRLYDYASKYWFMFATPVLSNGGSKRGLPISCFLNYVGDSREDITDTFTESAFLSSYGGGVGTVYSDVRSAGTKTSKGSASTGVIPFIKVDDSLQLAFSQGVTRRGSKAVYLDISHPEIEEFLDIRKPTGDANRRSQNIHHGVVISNDFMEIIEKATGDKGYDASWDLIDPHTGEVKKTVNAKTLWIKIIQNRIELGEPFIVWEDTINEALPDFQKKLGLRVRQSNLCTEITLPTDENRTAVCCLSSVNAEKFDEWKDHPKFIEDLMRMLDNVLTYFIKNAPSEFYKAIYSAQRERAVGLGCMGFHSYLQSKGVPMESPMAKGINIKIFKHLRAKVDAADLLLGAERGECPDAKGTGHRFSHKLAIAPNASSSFICGDTSPGIEPFPANVYTRKTLSGSDEYRNPWLINKLEEYGANTSEVWQSIMQDGGSVRNLSFLSDWDKDVFKTAWEMDKHWIIELAADRQKYICQGQSLNLYFPAATSKAELHDVHLAAWKKGLKTLYYVRSTAHRRAENVSKQTERYEYKFNQDCIACEG